MGSSFQMASHLMLLGNCFFCSSRNNFITNKYQLIFSSTTLQMFVNCFCFLRQKQIKQENVGYFLLETNAYGAFKNI